MECLVRYGYAGTTVQRVQAAAGVSRGALMHHFGSTSELLVAAIHHVAERQLALLGAEVDALRARRAPRSDLVRLLHRVMSGPLFLAGLELWVAARTNEPLRDALAPAERQVGNALRQLLGAACKGTQGDRIDRADLEEAVILLRGLAITSVLRQDDAADGRILARWLSRVA